MIMKITMGDFYFSTSLFKKKNKKTHCKYIAHKLEEYIKTRHCLKGFIVKRTNPYSTRESMNMTS